MPTPTLTPTAVIIVVGTGVMGVSAALALKQSYPARTIYLLSDISAGAAAATVEPASRDTGKIVRRKYVDPQYVALADEAIALWKSEAAYEPLWHGCGWWVVGLAYGGGGDGGGTGGVGDGRDRFRNRFPLADMDGIAQLEYDASSAWVDASAALETTLMTAEEAGVVVRDDRVSRRCCGMAILASESA